MLNSNQAFLLMKKLKSTPRGFTLGVHAEIEKMLSICHKLLMYAELYGFVLAPKAETRTHLI
jgi:hypothetical protein